MKKLHNQILILENNESSNCQEAANHAFVFREDGEGHLEMVKSRYWANDQGERQPPNQQNRADDPKLNKNQNLAAVHSTALLGDVIHKEVMKTLRNNPLLPK